MLNNVQCKVQYGMELWNFDVSMVVEIENARPHTFRGHLPCEEQSLGADSLMLKTDMTGNSAHLTESQGGTLPAACRAGGSWPEKFIFPIRKCTSLLLSRTKWRCGLRFCSLLRLIWRPWLVNGPVSRLKCSNNLHPRQKQNIYTKKF